jgi:hypothetical protein
MMVGDRINKSGTGKTELCLCSGTSITGARSPGAAGPKIGGRQESGVNLRPGDPENELAMRKNKGRVELRHPD